MSQSSFMSRAGSCLRNVAISAMCSPFTSAHSLPCMLPVVITASGNRACSRSSAFWLIEDSLAKDSEEDVLLLAVGIGRLGNRIVHLVAELALQEADAV